MDGADSSCVRIAQPSDAPGIIRVFRAVYEDRYPFRTYYDAAKLAHHIASDDDYRVVAVKNQAVIGHAYARIYGNYVYLGGALTEPVQRRQGVHQQLIEARLAYGDARVGNAVFFSEPVTGHPGSQRNLERNGFFPVGLAVCKYPPLFPTGQRESVAVAVADPHGVLAASTGDVYLTPGTAACLQGVLDRLGVSRRVHTDVVEPAAASSTLRVRVDAPLQLLTIDVDAVGRDVARRLADVLAQHEDLVSVEVRVDVGRPEAAYALEALKTLHFYASYLLPCFGGKDLLCVSRCAAPCDVKKIHLIPTYKQALQPFIAGYVRSQGAA